MSPSPDERSARQVGRPPVQPAALPPPRAAQDHPRRHGRVLRLGRAARRPGAARQAGRGRRRRAARRGHGGELRGARLRRALGDAGLPGAPAVPGAGLRAHPLRRLPGREPPDPRDLPRLHRPGRAALARRGLSRRHGAEARHPLRDRDRARDQARDPRGDGPHRLGGRVVQQVPGQGRLGHRQAGRPHRDPPRGRRRRSSPGCRSSASSASARSPRAR